MAAAAVHAAMNLEDRPNIHPFFTRTQKLPSPQRTTAPAETDPQIDHIGIDSDHGQADNSNKVTGQRKRTRRSGGPKNKKDCFSKGTRQASLERFTQKANGNEVGRSGALQREVPAMPAPHILRATPPTEDENMDRRKRRRTATPPSESELVTSEIGGQQSTEDLDWHQQLQVEAEKLLDQDNMVPSNPATPNNTSNALLGQDSGMDTTATNDDDVANSSVPTVVDTVESASDTSATRKNTITTPRRTPPRRKLLKLNNGKLLSPPSETGPAEKSSPKRRSRRKTARAKSISSMVVIKYGSDAQSRAAIGKKIADILSGQSHLDAKPPPMPKPSTKPAGPPKPTHPFFLGKPANKDAPAISKPVQHAEPVSPATPKRSAVTPGKLRTEVKHVQSPRSAPAFGAISRDRRVMKHPGMTEAPWPGKDSCHVRNLGNGELHYNMLIPASSCPVYRPRKLKNNLISIPDEESILLRGETALHDLLVRRLEQDEDFAVKDHVRLPSRLLTTGFEVQNIVMNEIDADLASSPRSTRGLRKRIHPALKPLYDGISQVMTPFDKGLCETQSWTQKYAPCCASDVLQSGKEATVLRDWLKNLTVMSVENRKESDKGSKQKESKQPPKKKRKSAIDDFIMGSDEEDLDELVEFSDAEEFGPTPPNHTRIRSLKTLGSTRNNNVAILSGPHGCGKSATVYAVAKELGFEVFEINSSSRRSGKDVQDRVGDMSENHLVNRKPMTTKSEADASSTEDVDQERISKAFQQDLDSGRQGTMTAFFHKAPGAKPKSKPSSKSTNNKSTKLMKKSNNAKPLTSILQTLPNAQRSQKQSLILLEEVDVLFEEDQQFWSQVIKLASQSKRPIVMTCTDERAIPDQALRVGAFLRFAPPPVDLAVDYMLLLCAREGHLLERTAIHDLYQSKGYDLRASITELDFWCQMSVGDRKGGLEWMYQRWPPGKDVDENGRTLRVFSQGTYLSGMGWLSQDLITSRQQFGFGKEEELLKEVWQDWGISPATRIDKQLRRLCKHSDGEVDNDMQDASSHGDLTALKQLDQMFESVSAADIYCRIGMPSDDNELVDTTLPLMPEKERQNYLDGAPVLQTDPITDFTNFDTDIFVQTHLQIQQLCRSSPHLHIYRGSNISCTEEQVLHTTILDHKLSEGTKNTLSRYDFSNAFDILAAQPSAASLGAPTTYPLTASSFDRTSKIIVEDLAPFVRCIVAHELRLDAHRLRISNLLSEGGRPKRARTTRASRVAMEGGRRETKRRDHWFDKELNKTLVMETAGSDWAALGSDLPREETEGSRTGDSLVSGQND